MTIHPRIAVLSVTTLLVAATLAGCAPATTPSAGTGSAPFAASSGRPKTNSGAMSGLPANCPTSALVSSKLGISAPEPAQSGDSTSLNCAYTGGSTSDNLSINFSTAKKVTATEAEASLKAQGSTPAFAQVSGVGDFAFYDQIDENGATGAYIAASSGPVIFHIVVTGSENKQQLVDLANAIIGG
jgi:hypothetical protein